MLNEGVHIDGIDGVVLFDLTSSPILYKQRIGRALSSDKNAGEAVIIDVANNWLLQIDTYKETENDYEHELARKDEEIAELQEDKKALVKNYDIVLNNFSFATPKSISFGTLNGLPNSTTRFLLLNLYSPLIPNGTKYESVLLAILTAPNLNGNNKSFVLFLVPSGYIPMEASWVLISLLARIIVFA